jgi:alkanesulfonate monooxygenase SsuD/methylene tetrahydromethanopterin reductase-like flavin-dependent oxidoreductase (luciferase family)
MTAQSGQPVPPARPRVGIFLDFRNPPPWERPWIDHYRYQLDLVAEAERRGAGSVWVSEHHNFPDGYLPQPLTIAAAIAVRTSRLRIGTAIVQAPIRHPVHLAEEIAVVDILSGGRLEVGLGAGYSAAEFALFDTDGDRRLSRTAAVYGRVRELLDDDGITPRPVQRPFPLWLGLHGPVGARRAGELGAGLLDLSPATVAQYRAGWNDSGRDPAAATVAGVVDVLLADDPERTWERVLPHYRYQLNTYRQAHGRGDLAADEIGDRRAVSRPKGTAVKLAVLSVDEAVDVLSDRIRGLPAVHVYTWGTVAGMPDDIAYRHLELLLGPVRERIERPSMPEDQ